MNELNKEQQYWSLHGSFEALHRMMELIDKDDVGDIVELKGLLLANMKAVHEQITSLKEEEEK